MASDQITTMSFLLMCKYAQDYLFFGFGGIL